MTSGEQTPLLYEGPSDTKRRDDLQTYAAENDVHKAASKLRDAIFLAESTSASDTADHHYYSNLETDSTISQISRNILKHWLVKSIAHVCFLGLIIISFVEPPVWCRTFNDGDEDDTNGCDLALKKSGVPSFYSNGSEKEIQDYYPNAGISILSLNQSLVMEVIFILVITLHFMVSLASYNFSLRKYFSMDVYSVSSGQSNAFIVKKLKISSIVRMIQFISILFLIIGMHKVNRPFAIFLRIIVFVTYSETAQEQLIISAKLVPALLSVSAVIFFVIAFYGILGVFLFHNSAEGTDFFSSLLEAMWTLWTSMTSVIYPDLMMSAYNDNRFSAIYFVSFMILTFFFLLNVIMALVFVAYENTTSTTLKQIVDARANYFTQAFGILDKENSGVISRTAIMSLLLIMNDYDEIRNNTESNAELMYALLHPDQSETIDFQQFRKLGSIIMLDIEDYSKTTWFEDSFPTFVKSNFYQQLSSIIQSKKFENAIDIAIVFNCIVVLIQSYPELAGQPIESSASMIEGPWEIMEAIIVLVYVLEMTAKIVVLGWDRYTSSLRNVFDALITILSLTAITIVYYPNTFNDPRIVQAILVTRIFRILRLFMVVESFNVIRRTFIAILPSAGKMIVLLSCIMYTFSAIGMHYFGGLVTRDPENPVSQLLEGTPFADALYWANNFNDLMSGINVIFNLLVINNWNEMESGILAVTQTKVSRWFFFTFYICGVIVVNNLVIALSIDTFNNELEDSEGDGVDDGKGKFKFVGNRLVFNADTMSKGKAVLLGSYSANLSFRKSLREEKMILTDLFGEVGHLSDINEK